MHCFYYILIFHSYYIFSVHFHISGLINIHSFVKSSEIYKLLLKKIVVICSMRGKSENLFRLGIFFLERANAFLSLPPWRKWGDRKRLWNTSDGAGGGGHFTVEGRAGGGAPNFIFLIPASRQKSHSRRQSTPHFFWKLY